jgi:hypothetical protein
MTRRQLMRQLMAAVCAALPPPVSARVRLAQRQSLARATTAFLQALAPEKRERVVFPFDSPERFNWHYVPRRRKGLPIKDMTAEERAAASQLLQSTLSEVGYRKAVAVMRLEEVLRQTELFPFSRDQENYFYTVFGAPGPSLPWGWRVEGHHLSLNFTVAADERVAVTPAFFGANPATVRKGPHQGLRTLAQEQDLAFELVRRLDPGQRQKALIATDTLGDIVSSPGRSNELKSQAGLPLGETTPAQREGAVRLLEEYVRNMRGDLADAELRGVHQAGIDKLTFAWAGSFEPGRPHYYRLHGPTLLIEYDNTQNDANHIHSVWHDLRNDFGADLLRTHYETDRHYRG